MPKINEGGVKTRAGVSTTGWIRIALYLVMIVVIVAAWLAPVLGFEQMQQALIELGTVLGVLSGGTAVLNVPKADDQRVNVPELLRAGGRTYDEIVKLRESSATADEVAERVERRIRPVVAPEGSSRASGGSSASSALSESASSLPVYSAPSSRVS